MDGVVPPPNAAGAYFDQLAMAYEKDYRPIADAADWLLVVQADAENDITLTWTLPGDFPANKYLTLFEVNAIPGRGGERDTTWTPVGNTAINMVATTTMTVSAGETRAFGIRFADHLVADLGLKPGWNLVSLPFEPITPAVSAIFANGNPEQDRPTMRDGLRGTINAGEVWGWSQGRYHVLSELHAGIGCWVYMDAAAVVMVPGLPPTLASLPLERGWNLVGVPAVFTVPADARLRGRCWKWDAETLRYQPTGEMTPFNGFWLNASEAFDLSISR